MADDVFRLLVPYGWTDRVLALWHDLGPSGCSPGRVVRVERRACVVVTHDGREATMVSDEPVAVGDWVATEGSTVRAVVARWSAIERRDPSGTGTQTLAANVDLVLVAAPADRLSPSRIERELLVAWDGGAQPVVVVTKVDLDARGLVEDLRSRLAGADIVATCAREGVGVDDVRALLAPSRTAVLIGPSGAGKSTLVNALLGSAVQETGDVRVSDSRGRHTTTSRQLLALPSGGVVIDTPGLRSLSLAAAADLDEVFPEIEELAARCRFGNCAHDREPGCAVTDAVRAGALRPERLVSYQKLSREVERERMREDPVVRQRAAKVWRARERDTRRNDKRQLG